MYGCRCAHFISYTGECWNGGGSNAGHRHTTSFDELRRIEHLVDLPDAGSGKQRESAQVRKLSGLHEISSAGWEEAAAFPESVCREVIFNLKLGAR
jgi:hypothetical protein